MKNKRKLKKTQKAVGVRKSNKIMHKNKLFKDLSGFPVVGIGASAGGLEAMEQFFENTNEKSGMAYVVVQHLDPTREGILPELLQRMTKMKVEEAKNSVEVQVNRIYVIPHNKSMTISKGRLLLSDVILKGGIRLPIDLFFSSLAEDMRERAVGIILSGMGSDGALGMSDIKEKSGTTAIQKPETAKFDSMPASAAKAAVIDIQGEAKELPERLAAFMKNCTSTQEDPEIRNNTKAYEKILDILRYGTGNDFLMYKNNMIHRRIERRMANLKIKRIEAYLQYIQETQAEVKFLFKELLIGVTNFFRDPKLWEALKTKIIPELAARNKGKLQLRAWVPSCSTGEEAYSLAIVFMEAMEKIGGKERIALQIFATDIDVEAVDKARKGIFPESISADMSTERLKRFFKQEKNTYRINTEIREMVVFAPQNAVKDPPFTNLDIISCRNLMIYMNNELQEKLLQVFRYSLNFGGILVLGSAETIGDKNTAFMQLDVKNKIFKAIENKKQAVNAHQAALFRQVPDLEKAFKPAGPAVKTETVIEQLIFQNYAPASVVVNKNGDIVHVSGHTGKYLELASGKTNRNIFTMLRYELREDVTRALKKMQKQKKPVLLSNLKIKYNKETLLVNIEMKHLENPPVLKGMTLIVFIENKAAGGTKAKSIKPGKAHMSFDAHRLRAELRKAMENLHAGEEEMQTSQEELKSVNEELQSNVEELQSSNEELTTSKEEMQSLNEELQTVNNEMQAKLNINERLNNDMKNIMNSTELAVLFIDKKSCITQFTFSATKIFNLIQSDIGRPFTDLTSDIIYPDIKKDITEVLRTLAFMEKEIPTKSGKWYRVRVMPYRTTDDRIEGLVMTFTDITVLKELEAALRAVELQSNTLMNSVENAVISLSKDGLVLSLNKSAEKLFDIKKEDVISMDYYKALVPEVSAQNVRAALKSLTTGGLSVMFETQEKDMTVKWQANKMTDNKGSVMGVIIVGQRGAQNEKK